MQIVRTLLLPAAAGLVGLVGLVGLDTLLAPLNCAPVPPPPIAVGDAFWLLEEPLPAPSSLVFDDMELERGLKPTCFIHMIAGCDGDGWRELM
jgi:hypothetical protein